MANPESSIQSVSPAAVLGEIAAAVPAGCRANIIIIGSLAVGYHYFAKEEQMVVRTKDADCLLSPRVAAMQAGVAIAEQLLDAGWRFKRIESGTTSTTIDTTPTGLPLLAPLQPGDPAGKLMQAVSGPACTRAAWLAVRPSVSRPDASTMSTRVDVGPRPDTCP